MAVSRSKKICLEDTPYYHCVSRCVRRAFLCGKDSATGTSYEHRRAWVEKRLLFLAGVFSIDVCAYAVMSNHLHVVLHVDEDSVKNWSTLEVLDRWHRLHRGTFFTQQYVRGEALPEHTLKLVENLADTYRARLISISWFMKELNEPIARKANSEDNCTGHFWEGRFKSQALLDEAALMSCMAYVDLNPIRSDICQTPEDSDYTSVKQRVACAKNCYQPKALYPFVGNPRQDIPSGLPFNLVDYLELLDMTGRILIEGKAGAINVELLPILKRLNISSENWLSIATKFEERTGSVVGQEQSVSHYCQSHHKRRKASPKNCQLFA